MMYLVELGPLGERTGEQVVSNQNLQDIAVRSLGLGVGVVSTIFFTISMASKFNMRAAQLGGCLGEVLGLTVFQTLFWILFLSSSRPLEREE